jgi:hypothetical protein
MTKIAVADSVTPVMGADSLWFVSMIFVTAVMTDVSTAMETSHVQIAIEGNGIDATKYVICADNETVS